MEQVYLYCRALADRPGSSKDWSRAVKILDHVGGPGPIPAFAALRHRLCAELATEGVLSSPALASPSAPRVPSWTNEYLLGVVAECELESEDHVTATAEVVADNEEPKSGAVVREPEYRTRRAAERARKHYNKFLVSHPGSFWGHYRAQRSSRMHWAAQPTSPTRQLTWRNVSRGVPTTRSFTITSPPA